jgi:hypothetical protein
MVDRTRTIAAEAAELVHARLGTGEEVRDLLGATEPTVDGRRWLEVRPELLS